MEYDKDYVQRYREKAVTDVVDFQVGKVYHSNDIGAFTLKRLITNEQHYEDVGLTWNAPDGDQLGWFEAKVSRKSTKGKKWEHRIYSLHDSNIGASYNPWLIFADKETMEEYKKGLNIYYPSYDRFDDGA